jgi:hypothetical protein
MTKVLALLTVAVLTFSAMTGSAFAQPARVLLRTYHVESFERDLLNVLRTRGLIRPDQGFYRGRNDALQQLPPPVRSPGFVDLGIFSRGR